MREIQTLTGHRGPVRQVTFHNNGNIIASASFDRTINLWEVISGRKIKTLFGHYDQVCSISINSCTNLMA
ncbi:WD40 repeat domain-containing protein [Nostoc sp.]